MCDRAHSNSLRAKVPGSARLPVAVFADLVSQVRVELGISLETLSAQTGIPAHVIQRFETKEPGSLLLDQIVNLLHGLDCRVQIKPVRNRARPDEPFEGLKCE
jgi:LysM repeat protein